MTNLKMLDLEGFLESNSLSKLLLFMEARTLAPVVYKGELSCKRPQQFESILVQVDNLLELFGESDPSVKIKIKGLDFPIIFMTKYEGTTYVKNRLKSSLAPCLNVFHAEDILTSDLLLRNNWQTFKTLTISMRSTSGHKSGSITYSVSTINFPRTARV